MTKQKGGDSILQIDDNDGKEGKAGLDSVGKDQINTSKGALYLGGLPLGADVEETTLGLYTNGFVGCVTYISFINTFGTVPVTVEMNSQAKNFYKTREEGGKVVQDYGGDVSCGSTCSREITTKR